MYIAAGFWVWQLLGCCCETRQRSMLLDRAETYTASDRAGSLHWAGNYAIALFTSNPTSTGEARITRYYKQQRTPDSSNKSSRQLRGRYCIAVLCLGLAVFCVPPVGFAFCEACCGGGVYPFLARNQDLHALGDKCSARAFLFILFSQRVYILTAVCLCILSTRRHHRLHHKGCHQRPLAVRL